jgi:hypothetical protein
VCGAARARAALAKLASIAVVVAVGAGCRTYREVPPWGDGGAAERDVGTLVTDARRGGDGGGAHGTGGAGTGMGGARDAEPPQGAGGSAGATAPLSGDAGMDAMAVVPVDASSPAVTPVIDATDAAPAPMTAPAPPPPMMPPPVPVVDAAPAEPPPPPPRAILVVGDTDLIVSDQAIEERLAAQLPVDVVSEADVTPEQAAAAALVVITSTASERGLGDRLRDVPVPVMLLEPNLMGLMRFTARDDDEHAATGRSETRLSIIDSDHELAAGYSGNVAVYRAPWRLVWGVPGRSAVRIATVVGHDDRVVIFAYPAGATMVGGPAAGKRLAFFISEHTSELLTPEALDLLDAAIRWLRAR